MSFLDIMRIKSIKAENEMMKSIFDEIGAKNLVAVKEKVSEYEAIENKIKETVLEHEETLKSFKIQTNNLKDEILYLSERWNYEEIGLFENYSDFIKDEDFIASFSDIRSEEEYMAKKKLIVDTGMRWKMNEGTFAEGDKINSIIAKSILRAFNSDCDYCLVTATPKNRKAIEKRIQRSFDVLNKLGSFLSIKIYEDYKTLKLEEINLLYKYFERKKSET